MSDDWPPWCRDPATGKLHIVVVEALAGPSQAVCRARFPIGGDHEPVESDPRCGTCSKVWWIRMSKQTTESAALRRSSRLAEILTSDNTTRQHQFTPFDEGLVDAAYLLMALGRQLPDFADRALAGGVSDEEWRVAAGALAAASQACREQVAHDRLP